MGTSTQIFNATKHVMKVQVGSTRYASDLITVAASKTHTIGVDFNTTYCEYIIKIDAPGLAKIIVSSDDLYDLRCITIKEDDGKLSVEKEPRRSSTAAIGYAPSQTPKKANWLSAWMSRSRRLFTSHIFKAFS